MTVAQMKMEKGHGRTRSRVGVQLKRALPRTRVGACGRSGEMRCILPSSRLRFSQKTLRASESSGSSWPAAAGEGRASAFGISTRPSASPTRTATSRVTRTASASPSRSSWRKKGPICTRSPSARTSADSTATTRPLMAVPLEWLKLKM
jgi:hypothetical protein